MKVVKLFLKIIAGLFLLACLALISYVLFLKYFAEKEIQVTSYYAEELPLEPAQFPEDFEEIHQIVLTNYSLYSAKQLNMDSLYRTFSARIPDLATRADYGKLLCEYFAALQVGHATVSIVTYGANYSPVYLEGRIFVSAPDHYIAGYGFQDKDEIIAINGLPAADWITRNEKYTSASTQATKQLMTVRKVFRSFTDTLVNYRLIRQGDTLDMELPLKRNAYFTPQKQKKVSWKILQDSIGYLAISSMMDPVMDDFVPAYAKVKELPYLIIDVRQNGGGNSGNGKQLCEYLVKKPQPHCVAPDWTIQPRPDAYQGKIYLLTGNYTFSAAESFVMDMRESGNAIVIGEATGGDTGNRPRNFKTDRGICFRVPTREPAVSPQGFPMEGVGIPPHYEVAQTVSDFMQDRDTALEFVLEFIRQGK